jgi:hypothetical protein
MTLDHKWNESLASESEQLHLARWGYSGHTYATPTLKNSDIIHSRAMSIRHPVTYSNNCIYDDIAEARNVSRKCNFRVTYE